MGVHAHPTRAKIENIPIPEQQKDSKNAILSFPELNPRLELGDALHPVGTYIYIPSKSPFEKGRLRGSLVLSAHFEKQKDSKKMLSFPFQS